jgi:hypothetical protein
MPIVNTRQHCCAPTNTSKTDWRRRHPPPFAASKPMLKRPTRARVDRLDEQVLPRFSPLRFFTEQLDALQRPDVEIESRGARAMCSCVRRCRG